MSEEKLQTLYEIVKLPNEEKLQFGKNALRLLNMGLKEGGIPEEDLPSISIMFAKLFVSADRNCAREECDFFNEVTGADYPYEKFFELTNGGSDPEFIEEAFQLIDLLDDIDRENLVYFGTCLLSCDKSFKVSEFKLLDRIMEKYGQD